MRRHLFATALLILTLAPAAQSIAKIAPVMLCGSGGTCHIARSDPGLQALHDLGGPVSAPSAPAPYYTVRLMESDRVEARDGSVVRYVPSLRLLRSEDERGDPVWTAVAGQPAQMLERMARGVKPFPAAGLGALGAAVQRSRVDEVFVPARSGDIAAADGAGAIPPALLTGGALVLAVALGGGALALRRRHAAPVRG